MYLGRAKASQHRFQKDKRKVSWSGVDFGPCTQSGVYPSKSAARVAAVRAVQSRQLLFDTKRNRTLSCPVSEDPKSESRKKRFKSQKFATHC